MSDQTITVRIGCSDKRVQSKMRTHMADQGWPEDSYYVQDHAGGPIFIEEAQHTLGVLFTNLPEDVEKVVVIYSHQDCAACKKRYGSDIVSKHIEHLRQGYCWVTDRYASVRVRLFFLHQNSNDDWPVERVFV